MRQRYRSITKRGLRGVRAGRGSQAARLAALERQNGPSDSPVLRILGFGAIGLGVAIFVGLLLMFMAGLATWNYFSADLPNLNSVEARQFETTRIYDRDWRLLYEVNDPVTGFRTYSSYDDITGSGANMHLVNSTVSAEDSSYWNNFGVDPVAIVRGAIINLTGEGSSGGSTITQQLVRQLYPETIGYERTYVRKMREAIVAMQLTDSYSKEEILEMYFNSVYYGNRAYGIDAAARTYFDKEPSELSLAESALLAGLPQAPSAYDPTQNMAAAKERQRYVLNQMISEGYISRQEAEAAWSEVLVIHPQRNRSMLAPHWVNFVIAELEREYGAEAVYRGGLSVRTSLDYELQVKARESIRQQLEGLEPYNANNGALVARLPATGEIVAMVGSNDYWDDSISGQFNVATSERQPGGAFMPLVYAAAFEQGWHPGRVILDYETRYSTPGAPVPEYVPENTTRMFHGAVTAREALARSLNVPSVKALDHVGIAGMIDLAHQMGIRTGLWRGLDFYGLALALGGGEVSPLELTDTYATFANNGRYVPHNAILEIVGPNNNVMYTLDRGQTFDQGQQVIRPETGYLVSDILSDTEAREAAFGADNVLEFPELGNRPIAVKTGTSFDWFDNWTVGYSTNLVVGAWIGNAGNQQLEQLDAMSGAAPIFHEFMVEAHQPEYADTLSGPGLPPSGPEFTRPEGITEMEVCSPTGGLPIPDTDAYTLMLDEQARPETRCDQLTRQQWIELQSALRQYSEDSSRFTQEGIESLLAYAEAVRGGVSIPNESAEPAATVTPTAQPSATITPRPSPTSRPTVTPWIPPTATPVPPPPTATSVPPPPTATESQQSGPVVVPDLYGLTQSQAAAALANRDLSIGEVIPLTQDDLPPGLNITAVSVGEVYFQSPAPGSSVSRSSTVSIAVRAE